MYYRVAEVSTSKTSGETFVLVEFWKRKADFDAARPPHLTNDFDLQLRVGDVAGEMHAIIKRYWRAAKAGGWSGDHTMDGTKRFYRHGKPVAQKGSIAIQRDLTDPHGILARDDVKAIDGKGFEEAEALVP